MASNQQVKCGNQILREFKTTHGQAKLMHPGLAMMRLGLCLMQVNMQRQWIATQSSCIAAIACLVVMPRAVEASLAIDFFYIAQGLQAVQTSKPCLFQQQP
jgi:hypothetical protein